LGLIKNHPGSLQHPDGSENDIGETKNGEQRE